MTVSLIADNDWYLEPEKLLCKLNTQITNKQYTNFNNNIVNCNVFFSNSLSKMMKQQGQMQGLRRGDGVEACVHARVCMCVHECMRVQVCLCAQVCACV